ncbi:thioredoxin family protein [bacterium]|nr:thioredoxin family protein [bacterium]
MRVRFPSLLVPILLLLAALPGAALAQGFGNLSNFRYPAEVSAAFTPSVALPGEEVRLDVTVDLNEGYHIYAMNLGAAGPVATAITIGDSTGVDAIGEWEEPAPETKFDLGFQVDVSYHEGKVTFSRTYKAQDIEPGEYKTDGTILIQICDATSCLPPRKMPFSADMMIRMGREAAAAAATEPTATPTPEPTPVVEEVIEVEEPAVVVVESDDSLLEPPPIPGTVNRVSSQSSGSELARAGMAGLAGAAFLLGLISLLTPCVFPMIPITISFFTKRAASTRAKQVGLSSIYAGSIVAGFAILGFGLAVAMRLFGWGVERAGAINQLAANPWLNLGLAALFIVFALSLFGLFEMQLPSSWTQKLQKRSSGRTDAMGAMLMAIVFVIVSFTCTGPIVGPLIVLTLEGHWLKPFVGLTAYAVGFSLPFFVLGLVPQAISALPKSGGWLNSTKVVMGFLELAAALKFLSNSDLVWSWNFFTREILLATWVTISFLTTLYLIGMVRLPHDPEKSAVGPGRLMLAIVFGTISLYLTVGLFGGRLHTFIESYLPPDAASRRGGTTVVVAGGGHAEVEELDWILNDYEAALALAKKENTPLFVDFTGWTCTNCRLMEKEMFPRPRVNELLEKYILVSLYTDDKDVGEKYQRMQAERFGTFSLPFYAIVTPDEETVATFSGLTRNEDEFVDFLRAGLGT